MVNKLNSWPLFTAVHGLFGLLLLAWLCGSAPSWAGKYAYGEKFVRVGQSWPDAGPLNAATEPGRESQSADDGYYRELVVALEIQNGPYNDALAEPLASLGRYHRQRGELDQAMRVYRRALHVLRVNDGLYSERQLPILRELLDAYRVSGDMQALDDRYDYYFRLYGSGQPPHTEVRLRASLAYLRWQREAIRLGVDSDDSRRLLALVQLNDDLLDAVAADVSVSLHWYRDLVLSQLRNLYLLEDRFAPKVENAGVAPITPLIGNEWSSEDFNRRRLESMQRGSRSRGVSLLQQLIARTETSGQTIETARLHLELADWYQWHGSHHRAGEQYATVVQLLSGAEQAKLLQQWLGQPVELPDNGAFWQPPPAVQNASPQVVISMRYDVSARGRVSNMQASVADSRDEGLAARLKRKLGQIRFRPRWVSGVAEPVEQVQRDYVLLD